MLCDSFGALGGVAQIVEDLAAEFARAGHRVAIVSNPHKDGNLMRQQNPAVEQVWVDLPRAKPFSWRHPERLWRRPSASHLAAFIRRWAPDLINIHGGLRDRFPAVLAACRRTEVPIVQSFHLVPEPVPETAEAARLKKFSGMALRAARAITFPSSAVKEGFQKISPEAERAQIIRGGVNLAQAAHAKPLSRQRPYIFSASRLDLRHKAVDALIAAFRLLAPEFPEVDLLIAGDGPQRTQIEEMIATWRLETRVHLLSSLPHGELWSLYKGALVFVMLSRMAEGLPLVFFEAMACGTPVIGTRTGGTPEIVIHKENGLLVERNESGEVAAAIRALLTNAVRRETMGRSGYELAKRYDWRAVASRYLELYQSLLASERRPGSNRAQINSDFPPVPSKS
ncbi:MAG: glycosyltransferase family 4 protein [Deltaproteobacteria bacterium]|nr:glycosyltransferase family 4 protein [Deltaproteobacteria bacterium]